MRAPVVQGPARGQGAPDVPVEAVGEEPDGGEPRSAASGSERPRRCLTRSSGCPRARWRCCRGPAGARSPTGTRSCSRRPASPRATWWPTTPGSPRRCCPHLQDRPLTLKRYPKGVEAQYFYEKQSPSHRPEWVQTARIGEINYTLAQDRADAGLAGQPGRHRAAHLAVAGRARPSSRRCSCSTSTRARRRGIVECCEVAQVLHGLFEQLGLRELRQDLGIEGAPGVRAAQRRAPATSRPSRWPGGSPSCSSSGCPSWSSPG